jgi:hypothetical protein
MVLKIGIPALRSTPEYRTTSEMSAEHHAALCA